MEETSAWLKQMTTFKQKVNFDELANSGGMIVKREEDKGRLRGICVVSRNRGKQREKEDKVSIEELFVYIIKNLRKLYNSPKKKIYNFVNSEDFNKI